MTAYGHKKTAFLSLLCALLLSAISFNSLARVDIHKFDNPQQEADYKQLVGELRCLVCQNQNLADSNAELATDLREQVYQMLKDGHSKDDIVKYMVQRYGDFVLYNPPVKKITYLLWGGPFLLLVLAMIVIMLYMRRQKQEQPEISQTQKQKIHQLLDE